MDIILSALAEAIMAVLIEDLARQPRLGSLRDSLRGKSPEQISLQRALARTYLRFAQEYPELTASLFDEHFLNVEIIKQELAKLLTPNQIPDIDVITKQWQAQFKKAPKFDLAPPIAFFIDTLQIEIKASPLLKPFVDSRAMEQLYELSRTNQQQVQLQSEIKDLLQDIRDSVVWAGQLQKGVVVFPHQNLDNKSAPESPGNLFESERDFVQYWLKQAKLTKEYNKSQFQHHFRVATILYGQTGLPNSLENKECAEQLTEQVVALAQLLVNQRDEQSLLMLEWGYQASKAIQQWKDVFDITWETAFDFTFSKHEQSLTWIKRLEKLIPKLDLIGNPEKAGMTIEGIIVFFEIWVDVLKGQCMPDIYRTHTFMKNVEDRLGNVSVLPHSEKQPFYDMLAIHYSNMANDESNRGYEFLKQKQFEQALHHYEASFRYVRRAKLNSYSNSNSAQLNNQEVRVRINMAEVYEKRDQNNDFDAVQTELSMAYDSLTPIEAKPINPSREEREELEQISKERDRLRTLIMIIWARANHNTGRPKEDTSVQERFMTNIKWDYKARAPFTIKKLNYALEFASKSESEDLFPQIHFLLSHAYFDLENKTEALRHIRIAIDLYTQERNLHFVELARNHEKRIKRSQSFFGF